jgi:hypothetical protein
VWDHGIVVWIGVLGDVQVFLDFAPGIGEKGPVRTDSGAEFIRLGYVVSADRDQAAIANLKLPVELNKAFVLPAVFWAKTSPAKNENHWMLSL